MAEDEDGKTVRGLSDWLKKLRLTQYEDAAQAWCEENGAVDIEEVKENWEDMATDLKLKPLEKKRVEKDVAAAASDSGSSAGAVPPSPSNAGEAWGAVSAGVKHGGKSFGDPKNPYYILEEIGNGATAVVYRCQRGEQIFAVKCIGLQKLKLQQNYQRTQEKLQRETHILFSLRHSNIVAMHDVHETSDKLYLVMEFVPGGELFEYIVKRQAMQETEAKFVFLQLIDALKYIHAKGVVHRDLKPENILVNTKDSREGFPSVKISDFGHSKLINDGFSTALTRVGTPQYWAPEVSDGDRASEGYDWSVDLWSLGVVLYVMLEGCYPFDGVDEKIESQIKKAKINFHPTSRSTAEARDLITGLVRLNPKDRYSLDTCSKHEWLGSCAAMVMNMSADQLDLASQVSEECLELPYQKDNFGAKLRRALEQFSTVHKVSAVLNTNSSSNKLQVVFTMSASSTPDARNQLMALLDQHYPGEGFSPVAGSGEPKLAAPGKREQSPDKRTIEDHPTTAQVKPKAKAGGNYSGKASGKGSAAPQEPPLIRCSLRVGDNGAGMELEPEEKGMRVLEIDDDPGQPGMKVGDLIVKINEVTLAGKDEDEVEEKFGSHFSEGATLDLQRD